MKVLIGVDGSACSDAALRHVMGLPWPAGTTFLAMSVSAPIFIGAGETGPFAVAELTRQQDEYHQEIAAAAADRLRRAGLQAAARAGHGDPRRLLEETAGLEHADLLVVGSHGRTGIKKLLLGSVATHVVAHAPCPVLVVKMPVAGVSAAAHKSDAPEALSV
jgi:nucleotide-binding universal stress UspA family protein